MDPQKRRRPVQRKRAPPSDGDRATHRTSNQVVRLMNRMTRLMYPGRGIDGNHTASERRLRWWALMANFVPPAHLC